MTLEEENQKLKDAILKLITATKVLANYAGVPVEDFEISASKVNIETGEREQFLTTTLDQIIEESLILIDKEVLN